jgi:hypothetical protein
LIVQFKNSKDESLLALYESIRRQVDADKAAGGRYGLVSDHVREYADRLRTEMDRRQLRYEPIAWAG